MADHGTRYRLVTTQDGNEHVSSVVLARHELADHLDTEKRLLELSDWNVTRGALRIDAQKLVAQKRIRRTIEVRSYTPLDDILHEEVTP